MIDLTSLSDKELFDLARRVKEESKARDENRLYKSQISLGEDRYKNYSDIFIKEYKAKGCEDVHSYEVSPSPLHTIPDNLRIVCNLLTGNYSVKVTDQGYKRIVRESRLIQKDPERYLHLWLDFMNVCDKYMKIKEDEYDVV